jgi:hypothetical protein
MGWLDFLFGDKNKGRDGASPQTAIIVESIAAEYQWVRDHCPGYAHEIKAPFQQIDGKPYDVLTVRSPNGDVRTIYFDISRFYGH